MKILVIGGTVFVGRHFVEAALQAGHDVTIFHRGTHPNPFNESHEILGDRDRDLDRAAGQDWDVVADTCAYFPEHVEEAGRALGHRTKRYLFISTISVYSDLSQPNNTEDTSLRELNNLSDRTMGPATYGPLKVLCEARAREIFGEARTLIVRPGLIVGPHDPTGRYTYWIERLAVVGKLFVPTPPDAPSQFVDVRDLAAFLLQAIEQARTGIVHVTGPAHPLTMQQFLEQSKNAIGSSAEFLWSSDTFPSRFEKQSQSIPFWFPPEQANLLRVDCSKALSWGLEHRPIGETARDTFQWAQANESGTSKFLSPEEGREIVKQMELETKAV